ncbi:hypothetical protein [Microcystis phage Mae-JY24]
MTPEQWANLAPGDVLEHVRTGEQFTVLKAAEKEGHWWLEDKFGKTFATDAAHEYVRGTGGLF